MSGASTSSTSSDSVAPLLLSWGLDPVHLQRFIGECVSSSSAVVSLLMELVLTCCSIHRGVHSLAFSYVLIYQNVNLFVKLCRWSPRKLIFTVNMCWLTYDLRLAHVSRSISLNRLRAFSWSFHSNFDRVFELWSLLNGFPLVSWQGDNMYFYSFCHY